MAKMMKAVAVAFSLGAAALASSPVMARPQGGGHGGSARAGAVHGGYGGGYRGGHGGYRGYFGYGGPYWWGAYPYAAWGWYPGVAYYPGYYEDFDYYDYYEPAPPPPVAYPAPAPRPEPAPQPAPAATPKAFVVYFPFDSDALTPEARHVIEDAALYDSRFGDARATIVGYTDAAGSEGYNQALSERRSQVVRQALVADGVGEGAVDMAWKGKHDLAVRTPDGVRQPANRRVTILVRTASEPPIGPDYPGAPAEGER